MNVKTHNGAAPA